jgi:hypothetical protein
MRTLLRYAIVLAVVYMAAWTASYAVMFVSRGDGLDFTHFFEYLRLAWTFSGGELPSFIWLFSVIAFLPFAGLAVLLLRRNDRRNNTVA